jgi:hypothetical protein
MSESASRSGLIRCLCFKVVLPVVQVVHARTHESVKAFKCQTCQRTYSNQRALKEHERTHTVSR